MKNLINILRSCFQFGKACYYMPFNEWIDERGQVRGWWDSEVTSRQDERPGWGEDNMWMWHIATLVHTYCFLPMEHHSVKPEKSLEGSVWGCHLAFSLVKLVHRFHLVKYHGYLSYWFIPGMMYITFGRRWLLTFTKWVMDSVAFAKWLVDKRVTMGLCVPCLMRIDTVCMPTTTLSLLQPSTPAGSLHVQFTFQTTLIVLNVKWAWKLHFCGAPSIAIGIKQPEM